jgi:hypothetical protein
MCAVQRLGTKKQPDTKPYQFSHSPFCQPAHLTIATIPQPQVQFSTFTRWCWLIQGLFYASSLARCQQRAKLAASRATHILFQISWASAILVTVVSYGVLVPACALLPVPAHKQDMVTVLLSPQGHIMHSFNTFMIWLVFKLDHTLYAQPRDFPYFILFCMCYVGFEYWFHATYGLFHYPFLDYNKPFPLPECSYAALIGVSWLFWSVICKVSAQRRRQTVKLAEKLH